MNSSNIINENVENTMDSLKTVVIENMPDVLIKYKIPELKSIAQKNNLNVSGTKTILINRIMTFYEKCRCATIIQKSVRRWFVRLWMNTRSYVKNTNHINDADFYTFEPIIEIPYKYYFSYSSSGNIYGFRVQSFIHLVYKSMIGSSTVSEKCIVLNPYNREPISEEIIMNLFRFIRLYRILFEIDGKTNELLEDGCENLYDIIYIKPEITKDKTDFIKKIHYTIIKQNITRKLEEIRKKTIIQRIINLFMDIDLLGNYTSYTWFSNLTTNETIIYWGLLYDIWLYRAGIMDETKKLICPFHDPFHKKILSTSTTIEDVIDHCLYAMENMVYMSPEEEYRKLGAMYVLCALTFVSNQARYALPWLVDIVGW